MESKEEIKKLKAAFKKAVDGFFSPHGTQGIKGMKTRGVLRIIEEDDGYIIMEKKCSGCGEWLAFDTELWTPQYCQDNALSVGLLQPCKGCYSETRREIYAANKLA